MGQISLPSLFPQDLTGFFLKYRDQQMTDWWFLFPLHFPGQWDATYRNPIPPGETTTLNRTRTPESRSTRRISVTQLFLPSLAKHLFIATIHHKRPPPRPWCASYSVQSRGLEEGVGWYWSPTSLQVLARRETKWDLEDQWIFHWSSPSPPETPGFPQWYNKESALPWRTQNPDMTKCPLV